MNSFGITDPWAYLVGVVLIVLLPGPNSLFVLSVAAQRGVRAGYMAAGGVFIGDAVLLKSAPQVFFAVKVAGAAYLAWLGLGLIRSAWQAWRQGAQSPQAGASAPVVDAHQPLRKALLISLLNPKAIIFLLSFFLQFVDPAYPHPALTFLLLGAIGQAVSALYLSTLIFAGARLATALRARRRLSSAASAGVGVLFLGFGAKLAATSL